MPFTDSELLDEIKRLLDKRENFAENVPEAPNFTSLSHWVTKNSAQGQKGQKTPRMNLAIDEDVYEYIRNESRKEGLTYSEFICAVMRQRGNFINIEETEEAWQKNYDLYKEFKQTFCREPNHRELFSGILLSKWTDKQKQAFNIGNLSDERTQKLVDIGFPFDNSKK